MSSVWAAAPRNSITAAGTQFSSDYCALTPDGAEYLIDQGVELVGIDALSIDGTVVIGEGERGEAEARGALDERLGERRAVEEGERGAAVQLHVCRCVRPRARRGNVRGGFGR